MQDIFFFYCSKATINSPHKADLFRVFQSVPLPFGFQLDVVNRNLGKIRQLNINFSHGSFSVNIQYSSLPLCSLSTLTQGAIRHSMD